MHKNIDLSSSFLKTNHLQSNPSNSKSKLQSTTTNLLHSIIKSHQTKSNPSRPSTNQPSIKHGEDLNNFIWDYIPPSSHHIKSADYDDHENRLREIICNPILKPRLESQNSKTDQLSSSDQVQEEIQVKVEAESTIIPRPAPFPILNQTRLSSIPKHFKPKLPYQSEIPKIEEVKNSNSITESDHQIHNEHSINKLPPPPSSSSQSTSDHPSTPITPKLIRTAGSSTSSSKSATSTEFKVLPRIGPKPNQIDFISEIQLENQTEDEGEGQEAQNQEYQNVILESLPIRSSSIQKSNPSLHQSGRVKIPNEDYV